MASELTLVREPSRTPLLVTFPSLEELRLRPVILLWLHLLVACEDDQLWNGLAPPAAILNTNVEETLKLLDCPRNTPVGPILLYSISSFRNFVTLCVANDHCDKGGACLFRLTDDDVENLAVALPSLVSLQLGKVCGFNTCCTSVSSLLSISIYCLGLTPRDTQAIVGDIQRLLDELTLDATNRSVNSISC